MHIPAAEVLERIRFFASLSYRTGRNGSWHDTRRQALGDEANAA
jgi:hypothetical protein